MYSESGLATATGECTDCGRTYRARVRLTEGNNQADVRCGRCGHINNCRNFEEP